MQTTYSDNEDLLNTFTVQKKRLRSYIFRLTANKEDTEDLLQDTYMRAAEKIQTFKNEATLSTWLFTLATNIARDFLRNKKRWAANAMDLAKEASMQKPEIYLSKFLQIHQTSPQGAFEINEHINFCFTCIGKTLPIDQQVAVLLKEIFDFKIKEIAIILNETEGVVKHLLFNGRQTMQGIFANRCAFINKQGTCHQCTELNGIFNPKQDTQQKLMQIKLANTADAANEALFDIRTKIVKAIDPFESSGADLQFCHYKHVEEVLKNA